MNKLVDLQRYLENLLSPEKFRDYCPNGLQVEGKPTVKRLVTGVTACQSLIDAAVDWNADAILVHHGYFWRGEALPITGIKAKRIRTLLAHDINLLAYHLPLDAHPEFGNNAQLAKCLGLTVTGSLSSDSSPPLILRGELAEPHSLCEFEKTIELALERPPFVIAGGTQKIKTLAWCTGAGQDFIEEAAKAGVDAYLSGEISERTVHLARELGIHYFCLGHHASERYGVKALGEHLAEKFSIEQVFIDIPNPI